MESKTRTAPEPALARVDVLRPLGAGGGGRVRLVRDRRQAGALRALKTATPDESLEATLEGSSGADVLLHEARVLSCLVHPGVPRLFDAGLGSDGRPWLLLEYIETAPLEGDAAAGGRPPAGEPVAVARGLLEILAYLHRHGWLHRDVKPGNVLATPEGRIVLLDFGLAQREGASVPPRGTLPYVAPEVLSGEPADRRSDLWSAGAVLLRTVLGRDLAPNASLGPADVPDGGPLPSDWLRALLQRRPDRRFPTAEAALAELDAALGLPPAPPPRRPLPHAPLPAGRGSELDRLARHLIDARSGVPSAAQDAAAAVPGLVLVRGESGVGKSRLLQEFRLRALRDAWSAYAASCADERDAPLPAIGTLLDMVVSDAPEDSVAVRRRGRAVASLLAARADVDATETAARFLIERAAETGGLLLVVEDLQDASALALRALSGIARAISESHSLGVPPRVLVVASLTDRASLPEEVEETITALAAEGLVATIPLRPLPAGEVSEMVRGILGPRAPADRIAEVLYQHGGALPLFAEELLAVLVEDGALRHEGGRWLLDTRHAPPIPGSLTAAVAARLRTLPEDELAALRLVAVHELPLPLARAESLLGADAERLTSSLLARGLLAPARDGRSLGLVHSVIGQGALAPLTPAERARFHDRLAGTLAAVPQAAVRRAYHVSRGTDPDAGLRAATDAARRLRAEGEPGRAAEFVRQALRLLPERDPRIPRLRRSLAELLVSSGRPQAAANVFRDLLESEHDLETRARLLLGIAEAMDAAGLASSVVPPCREALALLENLPATDPEVLALRLGLLLRLAGAQRATGELRESIETIRSALPLAGQDRAAERVALLSLLGNVYLQLGESDRARQFHESCLTMCRTLGRRRGMATALHNLGVVHALRGEREEALRSYRQSLRLARRAKDLLGVAHTLGNLANLRAEQGDFVAAERLHRRSLAIRRRTGDLGGVAVTLGNMAGLLRARGRLGRALALLETAVRRLRALGDVHGEVEFLLQAASIHLFAEDLSGARPLLSRALERARAASLRGLEARAEMLFGRLERRADPRSEEWPTRLARAVALHEHVGDRAGVAESLLETALAERGRGRRGSAMRAWRQASAILRSAGSEDLRARAHLVRGRLESDRAPTAEGLAALERFHAYAVASGRRDYRAAAAFALGRARSRAGDGEGAASLLSAAEEIHEDLTASLPPALRRARAAGPVRGLFRELRLEIENGAPLPGGAPGEDTTGDDMEQDRLFKLLEINKQLNTATDMRGLLDAIMDVATEATGAERGFLILVEDGKISFQTARNFRREEVKKPELKISRSIVQRAMKSGQPILTDNATEDERFQEFKSVERLELKSIVSVPFRMGDRVIGALYLDNPARKGAFGTGDLQFLTALGDQAAIAIRNLLHAQDMERMNRQLEQNLETKSAQLEQASRALAERATRYPYDEIVGQSPQIREVLLLVDKVVDTDVPVLIQGESGTGKELVARAIHEYGRRKRGPFVTVNCGAITETLMESEFFGHAKGAFTGAVENKKGLFEVADHGTIFLDEIGEMNFEMQKKLLRVLQEREVRPVGGKQVVKVDVRVISATNRNLRQMMQEGKFREDLYYRIAVINVDVPPLRRRPTDIPLLVEYFVRKAARELGLAEKPIDEDALEAMQAYSWPGNVRELDNEVKKALTLSGERVTLDDLAPEIQGAHEGEEPELVKSEPGKTLKENLEKTEKALIERALEKTGGNQTRAAKELGISRVWLRKKMEKYGLLEKRP